MDQNPRLSDWKRLLVGDAPLGFLLEMVVRVTLVYLVLVVLLRVLGKRMSGQVSSLELAVMILLGAVAAPPFVSPERGLVPAFVILACLVGMHQLIAMLGARASRVELWTQGPTTLILKDGRLNTQELQRLGISNQQLFAKLRFQSVRQLGELKRIYFEPWGDLSLVRNPEPQPGLSVLSPADSSLRERQPTLDTLSACAECGSIVSRDARPTRCEFCYGDRWMAAAVTPIAGGG